MIADDSTRQAVQALIDATYEAMSTPGSDVAELFGAADIAIAGSGQGELWAGPDEAVGAATVVSSWGLRWAPETVTVWRRAEVAWAQILGAVHVVRAMVMTRLSPIGRPLYSVWRRVAGGGCTGADLNPQESPRV